MSPEDQRLFERGTGREAVADDLRRVVAHCGSKPAASEALELSQSVIYAVLAGGAIGPRVLTALYGPSGSALPPEWATEPPLQEPATVADEGTPHLVAEQSPRPCSSASAQTTPRSTASSARSPTCRSSCRPSSALPRPTPSNAAPTRAAAARRHRRSTGGRWRFAAFVANIEAAAAEADAARDAFARARDACDAAGERVNQLRNGLATLGSLAS